MSFLSRSLAAAAPLSATTENINKAKKFLLQVWKERATERKLDDPTDLSNACIFAAMFAQKLFGGKLKGNEDHVYVELKGKRIDLTEGSGMFSDFADRKIDPYKHDPLFVEADPGFKDQLKANKPRVNKWYDRFLANG